jgi:hypothetical protein
VKKFNNRRRWVLIGNAVNVRVSRWIGKQILERKSFQGEAGFLLSAAIGGRLQPGMMEKCGVVSV